jgi:hypothetical protein
MECSYCHKTVEFTITKLLSRCTNCDKDYFSPQQSKALYLWKELGKKLKNKLDNKNKTM